MPFWILGDPFLRNFITVYKVTEKKIGFLDVNRKPDAGQLPEQPPVTKVVEDKETEETFFVSEEEKAIIEAEREALR